jgi:hypothetical protein
MNSKFIIAVTLLLLNNPINAQEELYPVSRLLWGNSKTHFVTEDNVFVGAGGAILIGEIISKDSIEVLTDFYLPTIVNDIYVRDNILFALDLRKGLFIYDVSDIYNPDLISELDLGNYCYDFLCDSNYIYVALGSNGIKKVNVSNIFSPFIENESSVRAFTIQKYQSYLYCIPGDENSVNDSISILFSSNLIQGGAIYVEGYMWFITEIFFNDYKGFLIENFWGPSNKNSSAGAITILDMSNPLNPQRCGYTEVYDDFLYTGTCLGDTVLTFSSENLIIINAANNYSPTIISETPNVLINSISYSHTSISFPQLYISYDYAGGFLIIDIQSMLNPIQGKYLDTSAKVGAVYAKDSIIVAGRFEGNGLYFINASDMSNPIVKQRYTNDIGVVRDLKIKDDYILAASNKLKVLKAVGLDSLILISELNYGQSSSRIDVEDTLIAIGGAYNGVHLVDFSNPNYPQYITSVQLPASYFYVEHLTLKNNLLFVSDYQIDGPLIYDVSNPVTPNLIWTGNYNTESFFVDQSDTILYIGEAYSDRLVLLDIKDLSNTFELASFTLPSNSYRIEDVYAQGNFIFLSCFNSDDYNSILRIYDISNLQNIVQLAFAFTPNWALDVFVNEQFVFLCDFADGVYIYDISDFVPVELVSFTSSVDINNVNLNWITSSEKNNMGFEIHRKIQNDDEWKMIGFVEGKGTTTEINTYAFTDTDLSPAHYSYRLKQIDFDGTFEYSQVIEVGVGNPEKFSLSQNYPNPFNPNTTIKFSIAKESDVILSVFNLLGERVKELKNEVMKPGYYEIEFDASNLASGIYFYSIKASEFIEIKKMILLK